MPPEQWSVVRSWGSLRGGGRETFSPDAKHRDAIARGLGIESLDLLKAEVSYEAWLDGARIHGRIEASAGRVCGVSLEPFVEHVDTELDLRVVPDGSPNAPAPEAELIIALDAEDPPDVAGPDGVDVAAYVIEALGLALDPFARAPGATFEFVDPLRETSPFNVLSLLAVKPGNDA